MNQLAALQNNCLEVTLSTGVDRVLNEPGILRRLLRNDFRTVPPEVRLGVVAPVVNDFIAFQGEKLKIAMLARAGGNLALHEGGYSVCHIHDPFYKRIVLERALLRIIVQSGKAAFMLPCSLCLNALLRLKRHPLIIA